LEKVKLRRESADAESVLRSSGDHGHRSTEGTAEQ
jgi:hypothetical protein